MIWCSRSFCWLDSLWSHQTHDLLVSSDPWSTGLIRPMSTGLIRPMSTGFIRPMSTGLIRHMIYWSHQTHDLLVSSDPWSTALSNFQAKHDNHDTNEMVSIVEQEQITFNEMMMIFVLDQHNLSDFYNASSASGMVKVNCLKVSTYIILAIMSDLHIIYITFQKDSMNSVTIREEFL